MGVELALHQYIFLCGCPPVSWINDNRSVHAIGHVVDDDRGATVVHEYAGIVGLPVKRETLASRDILVVDVPRSLCRMEINRVWHIALVDQSEVNRLSLTNPDHRTRYRAVEGPGMVHYARSNRQKQLFDGERHIDRGPLECCRSLRIVELVIHRWASHGSITRRGSIARLGSATTGC